MEHRCRYSGTDGTLVSLRGDDRTALVRWEVT
jgi:hypothetical protein